MRQGITRWTIYLLALCIVGPAAGAMLETLRGADGSHAASPLFCTNPGMGMLAGLAAVGLALVMGLLASKFVNVAAGFSAAGIVMAWAAWKTGDIDGMIRTSQSGGPLLSQALEGAVFGVLGAGLGWMIWRAGVAAEKGQSLVPDAKLVRGLSTTLPVAVIAGAAAAWFIGISPMKGQAVFGAIGAGVIGAAAARLMDMEVSLPSLMLPIVALAVLGPLSGYAMAGGGGAQVVHAAYKGSLFPLANITALDWIAGALLGIPLGVAWAGSMVEKRA